MQILQEINQDTIIAGYSTYFKGYYHYYNSCDNPLYASVAEAFGMKRQNMVRARQHHTDNIRVVDCSNGGEGIIRSGPPESCDAMITETSDLMLCILTADCVPVYLYDEKDGVIGIAHSGRTGTMLEIGYKTVMKMRDEFAAKPENIGCILGPHICAEHYEVHEEDVRGFYDRFSKKECSQIFTCKDSRYYVDMGKAIKLSMVRADVPEANIKDVKLCTYENRTLPSWRRDHDPDSFILSFIAMRKDCKDIRK